jgi:hypothetical protein
VRRRPRRALGPAEPLVSRHPRAASPAVLVAGTHPPSLPSLAMP